MPLIGAHVSVAGGLVNGITNAENIGASAIQIFGSSPRAWKVFMPSAAAVRLFKDAQKKSSVEQVFLHAPYLVNLGSPNKKLLYLSEQNLIGHLKIADMIGAEGLIFHVGSSNGNGEPEAVAQAVKAMKKVLKAVPGTTKLIMENAAGGGAKLGATADQMAKMLHGVDSPRMAVCFDTQHAFAAGEIDAYTPAKIAVLFDRWIGAVGAKRLIALHVNDSKTEPNSRHDRHENIGVGHIGLAGFKNLAKEKRVRDIAWLLEVPGFEHEGPDAKNVALLKSCFKK